MAKKKAATAIAPPPSDRPYTTLSGESNGQGCQVVKLLLKPRWTAEERAFVVNAAIPGLDATQCKCEACNGVWWADAWMRDRLFKRIYAYNFQPENGDLCRDKEES